MIIVVFSTHDIKIYFKNFLDFNFLFLSNRIDSCCYKNISVDFERLDLWFYLTNLVILLGSPRSEQFRTIEHLMLTFLRRNSHRFFHDSWIAVQFIQKYCNCLFSFDRFVSRCHGFHYLLMFFNFSAQTRNSRTHWFDFFFCAYNQNFFEKK